MGVVAHVLSNPLQAMATEPAGFPAVGVASAEFRFAVRHVWGSMAPAAHMVAFPTTVVKVRQNDVAECFVCVCVCLCM